MYIVAERLNKRTHTELSLSETDTVAGKSSS